MNLNNMNNQIPRYNKQQSFGSTSSSPINDENQSKNLTNLSSILQEGSSQRIDAGSNNLLAADNSLSNNKSPDQMQILSFGSPKKSDGVIQVHESEYDRLMVLYKLMQGGTAKSSMSKIEQKQIKAKMIGELGKQVERRLSLIRSQHNHLLKQKQLCSIYGQKF